MKKVILLVIAALIFLGAILAFFWQDTKETQNQSLQKEPRVWQVKSIDTMKYSRDLTGQKLNDPTFDQVIETQIKAIAATGATHVAIGTPYDEKFIPFLSRWVAAARRYKLNVWFRGNFSGWEGWFGYRKDLTREEHLAQVRQFINKNGNLFENGDLFTPCPECEHGAAGDPRQTDDIEGFRKFLIDEFQAANEEFRKIGKNTRTVGSMNYDVASLVMNEQTANALGDLVVIDHYVKEPQKLADDMRTLSQKTQAKIMLGEFGAPIPDIHGRLTQEQQADWLSEALKLISTQEEVVGLNYWVSFGGSTAIFESNGSPKTAAKVLQQYYKLASLD